MKSDSRLWLTQLFARLEQRQANYAVLRVDEDLIASGAEVDFLMHPDSIAVLLDEIEAHCHRFPLLRVMYWRVLPRHAAAIIIGVVADDGSWDHCKLDVRSGVRKHGEILIDGGRLSRAETLWDEKLGVRRLTSDLESALLLLRNAADGRDLSARHEWLLTHRASAQTPSAIRRLGYDPERLQAGQLRRVNKHSLRAGTRSLRYVLRGLRGRARASHSGLNIVLYGPDGIGKSSQAERFAAFMQSIGIPPRLVHTYHAFVPTSDLFVRREAQFTAAKSRAYKRVRSHTIQVAMLTASFVKRLIYLQLKIRPMVRRGATVIHDRYLLDVFLKFQKTHGRRFPHLEGLLSRLAPSDDVLVLLRGEPDTVADRSGELTPHEVTAAYRLLDDCLSATRAEVIEVDARTDIETVRRAVINGVMRMQSDRFASRLLRYRAPEASSTPWR